MHMAAAAGAAKKDAVKSGRFHQASFCTGSQSLTYMLLDLIGYNIISPLNWLLISLQVLLTKVENYNFTIMLF